MFKCRLVGKRLESDKYAAGKWESSVVIAVMAGG